MTPTKQDYPSPNSVIVFFFPSPSALLPYLSCTFVFSHLPVIRTTLAVSSLKGTVHPKINFGIYFLRFVVLFVHLDYFSDIYFWLVFFQMYI